MKKQPNGHEIAPVNPNWIKRKVPDSYADEGLQKIILFFVINTPCSELSSSSIAIETYGWNKSVWVNDKLKNKLSSVAELKRGSTFVVAKKRDDMKAACKQANLSKGFHAQRDIERIVIYKNKSNEFYSVCSHIRNSLAHGRLAMYPVQNQDIVFVLEDGVKRNGLFEVRSRMVLKKTTLLEWIRIIESGPKG